VSHYELMGSGNESAPSTSVSQGGLITFELFYLLHNMAMALTRIRRIRVYYTLGAGPVTPSSFVLINDGRRVALPASHALYFTMPAIPASVVPGQAIKNLASTPLPNEIDDFLLALRAAVINIRTNDYFAHAHIFSCHSNCHTSCHSSRSRR
ncbi:MAG: hypothetical protein ACK5V3_05875, partial [Bdellovibrionales bacterium]